MTIHDECKLCIYCNHEVGRELIDKCIGELARENRVTPPLELERVTVYHDYCHSKKLEADFKALPVTITQGHLDMLNAANLMFRANVQLSVATNQKEAELAANKFIHEMSLEEKFITLKRLEAVAAMWSIALSKDKARIQTKLAEQERINLKDLRQSEERLEIEKERVKKREKAALSPTMNLEARQKEKGILAFMKIGLTREQAVAMITKAKGESIQ